MYNLAMSDLGLIIVVIVFWFIFFGPHTKSKDAGKKGGDKGGGGRK